MAQPAPPPGMRQFVPQHERVAASILRRKSNQLTPVQVQPPIAGKQTLLGSQNPAIVKSIGGAAKSSAAPPAPPNSITRGVAATNPQGAFYSGTPTEYPLVPNMANPSVGSEIIYDPAGAMSQGTPMDGNIVYEDGAGPMMHSSSCNGCAECSPGGSCWIDTFSLNLGVTSFKNGINNGHSGSFGFQQGINWGSPYVFVPLGMYTQVGFRSTQTEFGGTQFDQGGINEDHRGQMFVTAGFFRRAEWGWQGGVVFDYLRDEWISEVDFGQVRGELSWAVPNGSSLGLAFATSTTDNSGRALSTTNGNQNFETEDYYTLFYRVRSNQHRLGQWRVFAGFTSNSNGIIGSDFKVPLAETWSLEPAFTFVVPDESTAEGAPAEEKWNVAINLVWYPGRGVNGVNYAMLPMFDVADNGSMLISEVK